MRLMKNARPRPDEYAPSYEPYVARVPEDDVVTALEGQSGEIAAALSSVPPDRETFRYAPGKWTVREVVGHVLDSERVFGYRALAIARGETASLPAFDENEYARTAGHDRTPLPSLLEELTHLRASHVAMFRHLDDEAWGRVGTANARSVTPRALAYVLVGHGRHHLAVLAERYGVAVR